MPDADALASSGAPSSPKRKTVRPRELLSELLLKSSAFDACEIGDPCDYDYICRIHLIRSKLIELRMLLKRQGQ